MTPDKHTEPGAKSAQSGEDMTQPNDEQTRLDLPAGRTRHALAERIGRQARAERGRLKLTQEQVAEGIGLAVGVYSRMERGITCPSVLTLRKLAGVLRASADKLLGLSAEDVGGTWQAPVREESPEVLRLLDRAHSLSPSKRRLLMRVAEELLRASKKA